MAREPDPSDTARRRLGALGAPPPASSGAPATWTPRRSAATGRDPFEAPGPALTAGPYAAAVDHELAVPPRSVAASRRVAHERRTPTAPVRRVDRTATDAGRLDGAARADRTPRDTGGLVGRLHLEDAGGHVEDAGGERRDGTAPDGEEFVLRWPDLTPSPDRTEPAARREAGRAPAVHVRRVAEGPAATPTPASAGAAVGSGAASDAAAARGGAGGRVARGATAWGSTAGGATAWGSTAGGAEAGSAGLRDGAVDGVDDDGADGSWQDVGAGDAWADADDVLRRVATGPLARARDGYARRYGSPLDHEVASEAPARRWAVPVRVGLVAALAVALVAGVVVARAATVLVPGAAHAVELPDVAGPAAGPGAPGASEGPEETEVDARTATPSPAADEERHVVVHVVGQVGQPGVVQLPEGSRVADALAAAGGASPSADLAQLNLARVLVDGEQVAVAAVGAPAPATASGPAAGPPGGGGVQGPLDLNSATEGDLDALPGIGPVLAGRIVAWRQEHGRFRSVDELADVEGIGPALLERLTSSVRV